MTKGKKFHIEYVAGDRVETKEYDSNYHFINKLLEIRVNGCIKRLVVLGEEIPVASDTIYKMIRRFS
ncbi:hypothetical protein [Ruminococcus sp.]|uniref:hypothetical protein n=1 Tax=Ruminococcus sp. TaxID=41978 RepID=UPI001B670C62|nr:hypothetical protein [Ruminococcus sp.]MBP5433723.1 hypothetical protein [Ruminococcus sp.]